jgi:vacuole morphology and inheritance protein 14
LFIGVTDTNNTFSSFIEIKMLEKVKDIPTLLNEGITLLPEVARQLNKFNDNISKKKGDTSKEKQDFYDKCLTNILQMTKKVDDQVYNSDKGIDSDFRDLNEKVTNIKKEIEKKADIYNKYIKELKEYGKKIMEIIDEIRKLFDLPPVKIDIDDKNIEYPFYEYAKKLNKGFEEIQEIKKEVQKPMKIVMVVFGKQINTVTLDLLFIMDITESMQDLLDETRDSIKYILDKIKSDSPGIDVRFAYEGYRDFADLKEGEKYYTIDFETKMDTFKKKLDEIIAKGGGDDAEDVAGGFKAGLGMSWRSNARYAILIADAPGHGKQYHGDDVDDDYPDGDPHGNILEVLMKEYAEKNINLCLTRIDDYTDKMFKILVDSYRKEANNSKDKPKIEVIDYDLDEEDDKEKKDKKKKRQMGDLISKTAIEIYNLYSKKDSINQS